MNLDAYMDDFGRDLERVAHTRRRRRRRRLLRLAPALPVAAALVLALTLLPGGDGNVDAIAAARAALAPNGEIVYMKFQTSHPRSRRAVRTEIEQWYAADPARWRTRHRPGRGPTELIQAGGNLRVYDPSRDVVTIYRGAELTRGVSPLGTDPVTELRTELAKGNIRDDGVVTVGGRPLRRLVRDTARPVGRYTERFVYYMDPDTFTPVAGHTTILLKGASPLAGPEFTVTAYKRLPLDERLLQFDKTPKTRYVWKG